MRTEVVCAACGRIYSRHGFDSSCRTWAVLVDADTLMIEPSSGRSMGATAVPGSKTGHALMLEIESEEKPA